MNVLNEDLAREFIKSQKKAKTLFESVQRDQVICGRELEEKYKPIISAIDTQGDKQIEIGDRQIRAIEDFKRPFGETRPAIGSIPRNESAHVSDFKRPSGERRPAIGSIPRNESAHVSELRDRYLNDGSNRDTSSIGITRTEKGYRLGVKYSKKKRVTDGYGVTFDNNKIQLYDENNQLCFETEETEPLLIFLTCKQVPSGISWKQFANSSDTCKNALSKYIEMLRRFNTVPNESAPN